MHRAALTLAGVVLVAGACAGSGATPAVPSPVPPAPPVAAPAPEAPVPLTLVDPDGFCANAGTLLGVDVQACNAVPKVKDLYNVKVATADGTSEPRLVPVRDGKPDPATGPAAATAFLRRTNALNDGDVGLVQVMMVLRAYAAFPPPLDFDAQDEVPDVGVPSLERAPWKVVLYKDLTDTRGTPSGNRRVARGTLAAGADGKLAWTLEEQSGGIWKETGTVPAE